MSDRKPFSELPFLGELDVRHARDELPTALGTLSLITPAHIRRASALVREGLTIPLNLALDIFDPPLFERAPITAESLQPNRNEAEDLLQNFNPQSSSQFDGLGHVRAREFGYFDGSTDLETARENIGMHHVAERGIASRAVLLDMSVIEPDPFQPRGFTVDELLQVAKQQGVQIEEGDILLMHTGWGEAYLENQDPALLAGWSGMEGSTAMAEFLWDSGVAAVGSDNPSIETGPGDPKHGSLHRRCLPAIGLSFFELLDFRTLVAEARKRNRWEFFFVSVPLNLRGGVSSTANAMVVL